MSLLADLLSRKKPGSPTDGTETPAPPNVPPTLSKARGIATNVRKLNSRYVIVAVACVAFVAFGAFLTAKSGLLKSAVQKPLTPLSPQPVKQLSLIHI